MPTEIQEFSKTEAGLATLEERYQVVPDCKTKTGYAMCRAGMAELRTTRTGLDKMRLRLNAGDHGRIKVRNSEAKRITSRIAAIENPMKAAKKVIDDATEAAKQAEIQAEMKRIDEIQMRVSAIHMIGSSAYTVDELQDAIDDVESVDAAGGFGEFANAAQVAMDYASERLSGRLADAKDAEEKAKAAKIESARINAEREVIERQQKELAEGQAKRDEEQSEIDRQRREIEAEKAGQERKTAALEQMQADRERFADDADVLADLADQLSQLANGIENIDVNTPQANKLLDGVIASLVDAVSLIQSSDILASQKPA
jgi:DNA repair exonuclease SbcCD ATPase subunit